MAVMVGCTPPGPLSEGERISSDSPTAARHPLSEGERLPRPAATPSQRGTTAHKALEEIDSLMWVQPDSALKVMMEFAGSKAADSLGVFEGHYCQVLIAELLFKNDYGQSNRAELLRAVNYFDSLLNCDDSGHGDGVHTVSTDNVAFLDARAHYINGVALHYERDSIVAACGEYLKSLEVMESHFSEKELIGYKARFMTYTYNRLTELFSVQFMMESAIACGEQALHYCKIEPNSSRGVSNILLRLGAQYDKIGEKEKARDYYGQAMKEMPDTNSLSFRDLVSIKTLCDYQLDSDPEKSLSVLRDILRQASDESEKLTRYLTIGDIFYEEKMYDSAMIYLKPVYENNKDIISKIQAAEYLRVIYENKGDMDSANECVRFLADYKQNDGENKALVSQLNNLFKDYLIQKQANQAEKERALFMRKIKNILVPIVLVALFAIVVIARIRRKKLLKRQQTAAVKTLEAREKKHEEDLQRLEAETKHRLEEVERKHQQNVEAMKQRHEEELGRQQDLSGKEIEETKRWHEAELEAERLAFQKEQDALRQDLQQQKTQVNLLKNALKQQREEVAMQREALLNEAICQRIFNLLQGRHITTRDTSFQHNEIVLKEEDYKQLKEAVERHYEGFDAALMGQCANLDQRDLELCHLYLLGLDDKEIAALRVRTYSAIKKHHDRLEEKLGTKESMEEYVWSVAERVCGAGDVPQSVPQDVLLTIIELVSKNPKITREEIAAQLGVSSKTVGRYLKKLDGRVRFVGSGYSGRWEVF